MLCIFFINFWLYVASICLLGLTTAPLFASYNILLHNLEYLKEKIQRNEQRSGRIGGRWEWREKKKEEIKRERARNDQVKRIKKKIKQLF